MPVPQSGRAEALLSAMVAGHSDRESPAWRALDRIVREAAGVDAAVEAAVGRLWPPPPSPEGEAASALPGLPELAALLVELGDRDRQIGDALSDWLRRDAPAAASSNVIGGSAVLHGPTVQAHLIHGGVHIHQQSAPPGPQRLPVPRQLPPFREQFVDRESDIRVLDRMRERRPAHAAPLLVVSGFAGVGKTSLVSRWLHRNASSYPDGHLYADLGGSSGADSGSGSGAGSGAEGSGPLTPATVLEGFLFSLGAQSVPSSVAGRVSLWRTLTSGLRLAVLLDNAFTAAQVRPLRLGTPTGLTVVTSRSDLTGLRVDGASVHRLDALPADSAVELLALGGGGGRVARDPVAAREVVTLCGRLPLAVCLASAQLAARPHHSVSDLAESLAQGQGSLDILRVDGEAVMRTALDMSYDLLPPEAATLYRRMGLLPTDRYDRYLLTAIAHAPGGGGGGAGTGADAAPERPTPDAGEPHDDADTAGGAAPTSVDLPISALIEAHLLEETGPGTYRFHDLVRPHARRVGEAEESSAQRADTVRRYVEWCLVTAAAAERILTPSHPLPGHDADVTGVMPTPLGGSDEALAWLGAHRDGLMGAVRHCFRAGMYTSCWRLVDLAWPLFLRLRPTALWIEAHRMGLDSARRSGSRQGEGRMLTSGAIGLRYAGQYEEAADWYRQALENATADGDVRQQAQAINGLGHLSLLTRRLGDARAHFEHALRLRESIGYARGAALTRTRLGETALAAGLLGPAAAHLRRAHAELTALGEGYEAARALALLGHVLAEEGDHEGGTRLLAEALSDFRAGGARSEHWEGRCLEWLGQAAESRGDTAEARRHYASARDFFSRLNPSDAERLDARLRHL
ncbi:tetratricopeptide repeat protein [Streptomyces formicae]|uniref:Transcriptional regulator, SARP family n=1 Tax=Streptomyces formicae TaxID=1616117 RepID=A0A291QBN4_9ACTN|nr:tetratricopeptide repeat protein [Streptomyces formicae]ATL29210.1 transcriptional regulator, SARP family [Streptomyces formicae]